MNILIQKTPDEDWLHQLNNVITDPFQLLKILNLEKNTALLRGLTARRLFPFRVPYAFVNRMLPDNPHDPLLRQVITTAEEFHTVSGFNTDPLNEQHSVLPGLLHKYENRVLMLVKSGCAIHCRYCFRRHFPYKKHQGNKKNWLRAIEYIQRHSELREIILSGGDPLMAKDHELDELICLLERIPHLKTLRIHSRLPIVIPARITESLCKQLSRCRMKVVLVTHINHPHEIDTAVCNSMIKLYNSKVILLNQSVLLRGVNDDVSTLVELSEALFSMRILPYYLYILDRVKGSAHFMVSNPQAKEIMRHLLKKLPGYLVPRLVQEVANERSKILIDLELLDQRLKLHEKH